MASFKYMAMTAILIAAVGLASLYIAVNFIMPNDITPAGEPTDEPKPSEDFIYTGPLQVYTRFFSWYNTSASTASADLPDSYLYHMDGSLFGSETGATGSISGELQAADNGQLKLVLDTGTVTTIWVVDSKTAQSPYFVAGSQTFWDHDSDGFEEYCWVLEFDNFGPLSGGQTDKDAYTNLYCSMAETSPAITSLVNSTGVSTSSYADYTNELYISSWAGEGYAIRMVKLELLVYNCTGDTATAGSNETVVQNGQASFKQLTVGNGLNTQYTYTSADWDDSNYKWVVDIGVDDIGEPAMGKLIHYDKNAGSTFAKIKLTLQCGAFTAAEDFCVQVKIWYISPAGVVSSMTSVATSFLQS